MGIPIHEILHTLLGEGSLTGLRCALVRTFGCNLKCRWCDTPQENVSPKHLSIDEITRIVVSTGAPIALITGGEPLLHPDTPALCKSLLEKKIKVIVETNGSIDLSPLDGEVIKIMDLKPPSSGFEKSCLLSNIPHLDEKDEIKIIIADREDYVWAKNRIENDLAAYPGTVNFSPLADGDFPQKVARWIIEDKLPVRFNLQIHKLVFPDGENGIF